VAAPYIVQTDLSLGNALNAGPGIGLQQVPLLCDLADIAAADLLTAFLPGFNGRIVQIDAYIARAATTAGRGATLTPKVGSTNVTGGGLVLTSANCTPLGARVAGAAITALNAFTASQTIGLVGSALVGGGFAEGRAWIMLTLANDDTRGTLAAALFGLRNPS
jgi:hypothetical protein